MTAKVMAFPKPVFKYLVNAIYGPMDDQQHTDFVIEAQNLLHAAEMAEGEMAEYDGWVISVTQWD